MHAMPQKELVLTPFPDAPCCGVALHEFLELLCTMCIEASFVVATAAPPAMVPERPFIVKKRRWGSVGCTARRAESLAQAPGRAHALKARIGASARR